MGGLAAALTAVGGILGAWTSGREGPRAVRRAELRIARQGRKQDDGARRRCTHARWSGADAGASAALAVDGIVKARRGADGERKREQRGEGEGDGNEIINIMPSLRFEKMLSDPRVVIKALLRL
jgi:hypothetical protein